MLATDLDGTLLGSSRALSDPDRTALEALAAHDIVRVVATGRNGFSFNRAVGRTLPIEFVVLSSGAAVVEYPSGALVRSASLAPPQVEEIMDAMVV